MGNRALILDMDNTLYDWSSAYVAAMKSQVDYLASVLNRKESTILKYFQTVYKKYGSVEVPRAVNELKIWEISSLSEEDQHQIQEIAWHIFLETFDTNLHLYPGVRETLQWAKNQQILIFGFSDSFAYWIHRRLKVLDIRVCFERVFAQNNFAISLCDPVEEPDLLKIMVPMATSDLKPNTAVIECIAHQYNLSKSQIYMVGDDLAKDIRAAQAGGIHDIWAKYGGRNKVEDRRILSAVTPWTRDYLHSLHQIRKSIAPSYCIQSFEEIKTILSP